MVSTSKQDIISYYIMNVLYEIWY